MKPSRPWILYSLLRVGLFAIVFAVLLLLRLEPWIAAVIAAVIGLCVTYIFFRGPREAVARSFYEFRKGEQRDSDSDAENAALDQVAASALEGEPTERSAAGSERDGSRKPDPEQEGRQAR